MEQKKSYETPLTILLWILVVSSIVSILLEVFAIAILSSSGIIDMLFELLGM